MVAPKDSRKVPGAAAPQSGHAAHSCGCSHPGPASCAPAQPTVRAEPLTRAPETTPEPITILLVDDDPDCRLLVRDAIDESKLSNNVFEVANGAEALDFLYRRGKYANAPRPGLVYLDLEMPKLNGQETLEQIRSDPKFNDIPIVMMTGVSDELQMRAAAEHGANSYTLKPANAEQFLRTVLTSTTYWLTIHQQPLRRLSPHQCRR